MTSTIAAFLVSVVFTGSGNGAMYFYYPMESMKVCVEAVQAAQVNVAEGGDSEGAIALFCVNGKADDQ